MARKVFYSFHYNPDNWRVSTIRQIGSIEGNKKATDNEWEEVTNGGDGAIRNWINNQLVGRSCALILIGKNTAGRKWINYEIRKAWEDGRGVVGIHIHNLKNSKGEQASKGKNPFEGITINGTKLLDVVKVYDPPYVVSTNVYNHISNNIVDWIEEAVEIRRRY